MEPIILAPGEGETVTDRPSHFVQIKAGLDEVAVTESRYGPGVSGPGPHIHREHADCFLVLGGELVFELGPEPRERVQGATGTFVLVPPNVVHTFRNEGPGDARFLNLHAPGMGFEQHLRELNAATNDDERRAAVERWDTWDPPAGGGRPARDALVRGPGEPRVDDSPWLALARAEVPPGGGAEPRVSGAAVASVYVLEGTLTLRAGDATFAAPAGTWASMPPGVDYAVSNASAGPARFVTAMAPAAA